LHLKSRREVRHAETAEIVFVIAIIAAIFRSGGFATGAADIANVLFFVSILLS